MGLAVPFLGVTMQEPTEYSVPTVRIDDGHGSYIVINKSDLTPQHTIYQESRATDATKRPGRKPKQD